MMIDMHYFVVCHHTELHDIHYIGNFYGVVMF